MQWVENWTFWHVVLRLFRQSNCLDRICHYRRQESSVIPRDCEKRLHGSSDLFRSQEAERILLCETVNLCWQWIQSKHHVCVPKRGSYYLANNSVRSRNHTMSVTLNLGAVGIIWPACKPVHILYLEPLHSRVRSQSVSIFRNPCLFFLPVSLLPLDLCSPDNPPWCHRFFCVLVLCQMPFILLFSLSWNIFPRFWFCPSLIFVKHSRLALHSIQIFYYFVKEVAFFSEPSLEVPDLQMHHFPPQEDVLLGIPLHFWWPTKLKLQNSFDGKFIKWRKCILKHEVD